MPFKSKSQARLFFAKEKRGELPEGTAEHWAEVTPSIKALPEHVKKKKKVHEKAAQDQRQHPDLPPQFDPETVAWTKGFNLPFLGGFGKTATVSARLVRLVAAALS